MTDENKEFVDETLSKRPMPFLSNEAITNADKDLIELRAQINNLAQLAEAMEKNEDWQALVKDCYRRMEEIAYDTMQLNPSDVNLKEKFAVHWGQFQERKKVVEQLLSVKTILQTAKQREKSLAERLTDMLKRVTRNGE